MKKILVINGCGGVGKDTFVDYMARYAKVFHTSIIKKVKDLAEQVGWNGGKTEKDRKFLADIKKCIDDYNDYNYEAIAKQTRQFLRDKTYEIFCVDIRGKDMIERYVKEFGAIKVLITRSSVPYISSNEEDAGVFDISYNYTILNDSTKEVLKNKAEEFVAILRQQEADEKAKTIYISHPFGGKKENLRNIEMLIRYLQKRYPNYTFISPSHTFGFLYDDVSFDESMKMCFKLLDICDEMWFFDDIPSGSKGCCKELDYCNKNNIPFHMGRAYIS